MPGLIHFIKDLLFHPSVRRQGEPDTGYAAAGGRRQLWCLSPQQVGRANGRPEFISDVEREDSEYHHM